MVVMTLAAADDAVPQAEWTPPASEAEPECGACAGIKYTGVSLVPHTCGNESPSPIVTILPNETPPASDPVNHTPTDAAPAVVEVEPHAQAAADAHTAERHFRKAMRAASDAVAESALRWSSLRTQAANAKKDFDFKVEELQRIANRGPEHLPLFDKPASPEPETPAADGNVARSADQAGGAVDAWRSVSIDELGLPPGITERLKLAGAGTIGELEALRAGAGLESVDRVGPAAVTKIEDAVTAWLDRNRDRRVVDTPYGPVTFAKPTEADIKLAQEMGPELQQLKVEAEAIERAIDESDLGPEPPSDSDEAIIAAGGDVDAHSTVEDISDAPGLDLDEPAPVAESQVSRRAAEINQLIAGNIDAATPKHHDSWESGRLAFRDRGTVEICPWPPGERQDDWLKGWWSAKLNLNGAAKKPRKQRAKKGGGE